MLLCLAVLRSCGLVVLRSCGLAVSSSFAASRMPFFPLCPVPCALCPVPCALSPVLCALCPELCALRYSEAFSGSNPDAHRAYFLRLIIRSDNSLNIF